MGNNGQAPAYLRDTTTGRDAAQHELVHRFQNHPPESADVALTLDHLTAKCITFAEWLERNLPDGREKSLALTNLEQVSMWGKAAIVRNQ